jgi:hypothetical protein
MCSYLRQVGVELVFEIQPAADVALVGFWKMILRFL